MSHRRAALYLQIPAAYCRTFGGLRWAQYGEAVEFLDGPDAGRTFAFAAEIATVPRGPDAPGASRASAFGTRAAPPLPDRPRRSRTAPVEGSVPHGAARRAVPRALRKPASQCRCPVRLALSRGPGRRRSARAGRRPRAARTAGAGSPRWSSATRCSGPWITPSSPRLEPDRFRRPRFVAELDELSDEEIRHWLKYGRAPGRGAGRRGDPAPARRPGRGRWPQVERRPRLAG